ncbi:MAG: hypothetical protein SGBAC_009885 [Bacillariaceae sp.]
MTNKDYEGSSNINSDAIQRTALSQAHKGAKDKPSIPLNDDYCPASSSAESFDKASALTKSGLFFRFVIAVILILLVAGMLSSPSFHVIPSTTTGSPSKNPLSFGIPVSAIFRQGTISLAWSLVNWMPLPNDTRFALQQRCWDASSAFSPPPNNTTTITASPPYDLEVPRIAIRELLQSHRQQQNSQDALEPNDESFVHFVSSYLIKTYGTDWKERPLLMEGLLDYDTANTNANTNANANANTNADDENASESTDVKRRLSLHGLLELDQVIPYFEQAHKPGTLTPTARAPVSQIVQGMLNGKPYKIGSQLIVQEHPELMQELTGKVGGASSSESSKKSTGNLLSFLFGSHFRPEDVTQGRLLPATTTVPVFVAKLVNNNNRLSEDASVGEGQDMAGRQEQPADRTLQYHHHHQQHITTGLHCEPIGNVAFQIEGSKEWTLVSPRYSSWLQPSLAADGRAFFASSIVVNASSSSSSRDTLSHVLTQRRIPHWTAVTGPSDALWVPTWTWHRVDYRMSSSSSEQANQKQQDTCIQTADQSASVQDGASICSDAGNQNHKVAIGGSIFHFRPWDFLRRNPLFAVLIVPALIKELANISTQ